MSHWAKNCISGAQYYGYYEYNEYYKIEQSQPLIWKSMATTTTKYLQLLEKYDLKKMTDCHKIDIIRYKLIIIRKSWIEKP